MKNLLNKIVLGDAYDLIRQVPDNSVDLIYTDIPYLHVSCGAGRSDLCKSAVAKKESLKGMDKGIDLAILSEFKRVLKKLNLFVWCSRLQLHEIMNCFLADKTVNFDLLVWCKTNPMPTCNGNWLPDLEYCLYFRENGVRLNDGYELKSKWYASPLNTADKGYYRHPTIKPLQLAERHILHTTRPGDTVLDPFAGSGTTALAASNTERNYIAFEINQEWHKIAVDRLNGIEANGQMTFVKH